MKVVGIIAEYNPFHKGHAYQLEKAKEVTGADYVVIVMSGDFVQRGAPALLDKYKRAEMALASGADLVLELPVCYASGSAEYFANGAISLLNNLGCVDAICFGSESGDIAELTKYANILFKEPESYQMLLKSCLKLGLSFPAARSRALHEYLDCNTDILPCGIEESDCRYESGVLAQPNNTLGIEYIKAILMQNAAIKPYTVTRLSAGYHDTGLDYAMSSATAIRKAIQSMDDALHLPSVVSTQVPPASYAILSEAYGSCFPIKTKDFSAILKYKLLSSSREELSSYADISDDLASRIINHLNKYITADSFADLIKTRQVTHTRITRAFCHVLLNIRQADLDAFQAQHYPVYARVLGFRRSSSELLSAIKQNSTCPLLTKLADAESVLSDIQLKLLEQDVFAAHVYESIVSEKFGSAFRNEYTRKLIFK